MKLKNFMIDNVTYKFPKYISHITLSYNISDFDYIGVIEYS